MWPWNASTRGFVYLFHFNAPLGNLDNPRAQASHYVGFAEDLEARIAKHVSGRGSKIVKAALARGITFEVYHWPAVLATEKLVKAAKNTARYCPTCAGLRGTGPRPLPIPATQLAFDFDPASGAGDLPEIELGRLDWIEIKTQQAWRAARVSAPRNMDALDDLL